MPWDVHVDPAFRDELARLPRPVRVELVARARLLREQGPAVGRPAVDTLKGSRHANMKELRFTASGGVWRVAFAFDRSRQAVLLAAGNKKGKNERRFYRDLLRLADRRFDSYRVP